jgi:hypothetical protein
MSNPVPHPALERCPHRSNSIRQVHFNHLSRKCNHFSRKFNQFSRNLMCQINPTSRQAYLSRNLDNENRPAAEITPAARLAREAEGGFADGLRRLPALHLPHDPLSTKWRQPGILVHVHPVLPRIAEASQLQLSRPRPDGQPNESSQLAEFG